jgi:hypothetical protein
VPLKTQLKQTLLSCYAPSLHILTQTNKEMKLTDSILQKMTPLDQNCGDQVVNLRAEENHNHNSRRL